MSVPRNGAIFHEKETEHLQNTSTYQALFWAFYTHIYNPDSDLCSQYYSGPSHLADWEMPAQKINSDARVFGHGNAALPIHDPHYQVNTASTGSCGII